MTPQEIFDKISAFLLDPTSVQSKEDGSCRYRGPNGAKCAVGILISDEDYRPEMDCHPNGGGYGAICLVDTFDHLPEYFKANKSLLEGLQTVHDYDYNWCENRIGMKHDLREIADHFNLKVNFE